MQNSKGSVVNTPTEEKIITNTQEKQNKIESLINDVVENAITAATGYVQAQEIIKDAVYSYMNFLKKQLKIHYFPSYKEHQNTLRDMFVLKMNENEKVTTQLATMMDFFYNFTTNSPYFSKDAVNASTPLTVKNMAGFFAFFAFCNSRGNLSANKRIEIITAELFTDDSAYPIYTPSSISEKQFMSILANATWRCYMIYEATRPVNSRPGRLTTDIFKLPVEKLIQDPVKKHELKKDIVQIVAAAWLYKNCIFMMPIQESNIKLQDLIESVTIADDKLTKVKTNTNTHGLEDFATRLLKYQNSRVNNIEKPLNPKKGGKPAASYTKSNKKYVGRDGVKRCVYVKGGKSYVKKRDPKTGKFVYRVVKAA